jgi:hypothetical protein
MGAFLEKPKTEKHNETGEGNGLRFGVSSMQGRFKHILKVILTIYMNYLYVRRMEM